RAALDLVEHDDSETTGDSNAAESRAVMSRFHESFERIAGEHGAERQSAAERFGERDDVGNDSALLKREHRSGASESALDFVEDENGVVAIGDLARCGEIFVCERNVAASAIT